MITFGEFEKNEEGNFIGELYVRETGIMDVIFQQNMGKKDNQPDYFAYAFDERKRKYYPIGKVWSPKPGKQHHYVKLESPLSSHNVIIASLFPDKALTGKFNLIWYSAKDHAPKAHAATERSEREPQRHADLQAKPPHTQRPAASAVKTFSPKM